MTDMADARISAFDRLYDDRQAEFPQQQAPEPLATMGMSVVADPDMYNKLPFIGKPMRIKNSDPADKKPQLVNFSRVRQFYLDDKKDMADWQTLTQRHAWAQVNFLDLERRWVKDKQSFMVYAQWAEGVLANPDIANDKEALRDALQEYLDANGATIDASKAPIIEPEPEPELEKESETDDANSTTQDT